MIACDFVLLTDHQVRLITLPVYVGLKDTARDLMPLPVDLITRKSYGHWLRQRVVVEAGALVLGVTTKERATLRS